MSNMSYCRYHNTLGDLRDCFNAMKNEELNENGRFETEEEDGTTVLSVDETYAKLSLVALCKQVVAEYGEELTEWEMSAKTN